jgi:hypothetical protein
MSISSCLVGSSLSLSLSFLPLFSTHSSSDYTLVAIAMKRVNRVSKRECFSFIAMLARAFFLVVMSSSLSSSSLEQASLS